MTPNEYVQAFDKAVMDLDSKLHERDILNAQIAGLRETVRVLSSRITLSKERRECASRMMDLADYATPTLANSIRTVLSKAFPDVLTAVEVRNILEDSGFNFDDFSNSLSACHATLKRMVVDDEVKMEMRKDGKAAYRKILKLSPVSPMTLSQRISVSELIKRAAKVQAQKDNPTLDALRTLAAIGKIEDVK